jgi:hypothetical protein
MTRVSGIAGAFVVTLALAPISADAQQIFACVNTNSGAVRIVAQGAAAGPLRAWSPGMSSDHKGRPAQPDPPVRKEAPASKVPQAHRA